MLPDRSQQGARRTTWEWLIGSYPTQHRNNLSWIYLHSQLCELVLPATRRRGADDLVKGAAFKYTLKRKVRRLGLP